MNVYLDYNGTTPVDRRVVDAMRPFLGEHFGNPSSSHWAGQAVRTSVAAARQRTAAFLGARPEEIVFTGGGSESDNLALKGVVYGCGRPPGRVHLVISAVEHPAVKQTAAFLAHLGVRLTVLPVDGRGLLDPGAVAAALTDDTVLVSIMLVNNETGVILPIPDIARITRARGVLLHTDAVQAVGKVPVRVDELGVDLLSLSGHKCYAPKGIGALWVRPGVSLEPLIHGGGQEDGRRSGTENVAGIVALGAALDLLAEHREVESEHCRELRDGLEEGLAARIPGIVFHGDRQTRVTNTSCFSVPDVDGESLRLHLDLRGIAVSAGSACASESGAGSPVLTAMGVAPDVIQGALRVSIGRWTTAAEIARFVDDLAAVTDGLWRISPRRHR
ncbi:MAG: cysteine desulfurase [Deltaproteobacteria bacterium]|nr:cysteine desulfurase [Candidatus Anaeroferrophillacea bacterium]